MKPSSAMSLREDGLAAAEGAQVVILSEQRVQCLDSGSGLQRYRVRALPEDESIRFLSEPVLPGDGRAFLVAFASRLSGAHERRACYAVTLSPRGKASRLRMEAASAAVGIRAATTLFCGGAGAVGWTAEGAGSSGVQLIPGSKRDECWSVSPGRLLAAASRVFVLAEPGANGEESLCGRTPGGERIWHGPALKAGSAVYAQGRLVLLVQRAPPPPVARRAEERKPKPAPSIVVGLDAETGEEVFSQTLAGEIRSVLIGPSAFCMIQLPAAGVATILCWSIEGEQLATTTGLAADQPPELLAFDGERVLILLRHEGKSWVTARKVGEPGVLWDPIAVDGRVTAIDEGFVVREARAVTLYRAGPSR